jgi:ACS family hexuronate transporter-like MFS transporter
MPVSIFDLGYGPAVLSRRVAWSVVALAMLTMTVSYIDRQTLSVIAPAVTKALDLTETEYGWLASAFAFAYLVATPTAGWWIDGIGARRGLVRSMLVWSSIAAMHALVPNFAVLFALRVALGLAEGPGFPGASQTVQRILPPEDRSRGFGLLFSGSSIGAMIAAPVAARLAAAYGWRFAFVGTSLAAALWIPAWILLTNRRDVRERMDVLPAPTRVRPNLFDLIRERVVIRALIAIFAAAPVVGFAGVWASKYLVRRWEIDQKHVGDYLWLPPLCLDAGAILFGDLASRLRQRKGSQTVLYVIAMLLASALALLSFAETPWQSMIVVGVSMAGGGALYTLCTADVLSRMHPDAVSFTGGVVAGAQSLAMIIMNPLIGQAVDRLHDYSAVALTLGIWALPGSLIWIAWRPRPSERLGHQV